MACSSWSFVHLLHRNVYSNALPVSKIGSFFIAELPAIISSNIFSILF
jgi:hypothetical protein